jgi:hypothetical protein
MKVQELLQITQEETKYWTNKNVLMVQIFLHVSLMPYGKKV